MYVEYKSIICAIGMALGIHTTYTALQNRPGAGEVNG